MVYGVEHEFHAIGNAELIEDAEQVLFDRVLAEAELAGNITITETFGNEGDNLLFAWGQQTTPTIVDNAE